MSKDIEKAIKSFEDTGLAEQFPEEYAKLLALRSSDPVQDHKEAEFVLLYITLPRPEEVRQVACKWCKLEFVTNYKYQKYCSTECLKAALLDKGLEWDPNKAPEERWHGVPPSVIRPATLLALRQWAEKILESPSDDTHSISDQPVLSELDRKFAELFG